MIYYDITHSTNHTIRPLVTVVLKIFMLGIIFSISEILPTAFAQVCSPCAVSIVKGASSIANQSTQTFYNPSPLHVRVNTKIIWTNNDSVLHTVTSGTPVNGPSGDFDSGVLSPGHSFSWTTPRTATNFDYFCIIHPFMIGRVEIIP